MSLIQMIFGCKKSPEKDMGKAGHNTVLLLTDRRLTPTSNGKTLLATD